MRRAIAGLLLLSAATVQVTWAPRLEIGGAFPNLVLVAVVGITAVQSQRNGMVWAVAGGLLLDLTSAGAVGPHVLALVAGAYLIGLWTENFERINATNAALCVAAATLVYSAVLVGLGLALHTLAMPLLQTAELAAAAAAYNALLAPLAAELFRRILGSGYTRLELRPRF